jgi:hypothetical protein
LIEQDRSLNSHRSLLVLDDGECKVSVYREISLGTQF